MKLDDLPDMELQYLALRKAFQKKFASIPPTVYHSNMMSIRLFGFILSFLAPETVGLIYKQGIFP